MIKFIRYNCVAICIGLILCGLLLYEHNLMLVGLVFLWANNICYAIEKAKERILFLFFQIVFFVFLMGRPLIRMLRGDVWWKVWGEENVNFALLALGISLVSMFIGALLVEKGGKRQPIKPQRKPINFLYKQEFQRNLQIVALILFYITAVFYFAEQMERLLFVQGRGYLSYYTDFESKLPTVFHTIASFMKYSLCIFLATMPLKKRTLIPLIIFELSAVPMLLVGLRNPIMLNSIFIFLYYFVRDVLDDKEKWIGRVEKTLLAIGAPAMLAFMGIYDFIRRGVSSGLSMFDSLVEFFYGQGVSFEVLAIGYNSMDQLPERAFRNYTFGPFLDYFIHGTLGQKLFGTEALPSGNNLVMALESNSFAHNMSYVAREDYLDGHGWGSSFILEVFADYGYIGIIVASVLLGVLLIMGIRWFNKNTFLTIVILLSLTNLFFVPRADATGWLLFLVTVQFWACFIVCYVMAGLCMKTYERKRNKDDKGEQNKCLNILD